MYYIIFHYHFKCLRYFLHFRWCKKYFLTKSGPEKKLFLLGPWCNLELSIINQNWIVSATKKRIKPAYFCVQSSTDKNLGLKQTSRQGPVVKSWKQVSNFCHAYQCPPFCNKRNITLKSRRTIVSKLRNLPVTIVSSMSLWLNNSYYCKWSNSLLDNASHTKKIH